MDIKLVLKEPKDLDNPNYTTDKNGAAKLALSPDTYYKLVAYKPGFEPFEQKLSSMDRFENLSIKMEEIQCLPLTVDAYNADNQKEMEFSLIVRPLKGGSKEKYTFPGVEEICLKHHTSYEMISRKEGWLPDTFLLAPQDEHVKKASVTFRLLPVWAELSPDETTEVHSAPPIEEATSTTLIKGATIELRNIYYDYNKSSIQTGAEDELDALVTIMKQDPKMRIEMSAHTDSRGGSLYNLRLSLRRALSAKKYLLQHGIESSRIRAVGYGESLIRNQCKEGITCTDEEHQLNRRTEIKILEIDTSNPVEIKYSE
jgi:outer membrane protein OmpA-like peptidoglycan-associated protein